MQADADPSGPVSVIVVSRGRPEALLLCLLALAQQDCPAFEVIVVACPAGMAALRNLPFADRLKAVAFDQPNISAARNIGLRLAAGRVVAFIDDDACAEPTWLSRLVQPLLDGAALAAGGFVRARNGISLQWGAKTVNAQGRDRPLDIDAQAIAILPPPAHGAIRTEGTNMAFDRQALLSLGGFDPAYAFYLDETDVNMRMAATSAPTALVPLAQVHHGFKPSAYRSADRAPRALFDIGRSQMVFLRKFATLSTHATALQEMRQQQRKRLITHLISGGLEPCDIRCLMADLDAGIDAGAAVVLDPLPPLLPKPPPFRALPSTGPRDGCVIAGWAWTRHTLEAQARRALAQDGAAPVVTVFCLSPTRRAHWHRFHPGGYWLQTGGVSGRSDRGAPVSLNHSVQSRVALETARLAPLRPVTPA